ncbi:MAG: glutaredoxin 3 [Rhodospirillaceae bacterium]|jgi:glutaredoxin 3|nr:glutaredoxin 3 [Rhodospirillaceae bacterium]MBT6138433.1 glutaredoxin 3 [Rhodospirillaceae bacterium]
MAKVEIYTTKFCPFCSMALRLLDMKGAEVVEYDVSSDPDGRRRMMERANGGRTVPQIFIEDVHVGGCDELMALDSGGKLDPMLKLAG